MRWFRRSRERAEERAARRAEKHAAEDARVASRRAFFKLGVERARDTGVAALRTASSAMAAANEAVASLAEPDPLARTVELQRRARAAWETEARRQPSRPARPVVRPPGAIPEPAFLAACERCRLCVEACPHDAIRPLTDDRYPDSLGTPWISPMHAPCMLCRDVPCASACPTGALLPLPVTDIRIGTAVVFRDLCLNGQGEMCEVCVDVCPVPGAMKGGEDGFPAVDAAACTGCGQCVRHCPTYPVALHVMAR